MWILTAALLCATPAHAEEAPPPDDPSLPTRRALTLRTAGQVTTGLALAGLTTTLFASQRGGDLDRAMTRALGYGLSTPLLAVGAVMWGVGDARVRRADAAQVALLPSLGPSEIGVAVLVAW
jgi:hypothetical protein